MVRGRLSRDRVATMWMGIGQRGRGRAHRVVGAVGHVAGVEGEDGSPGTHVEDAPLVLQQQGAVVAGVRGEAPDSRQLCKGNRGLRGTPGQAQREPLGKDKRMELEVGGMALAEVIRQAVLGDSSSSRRKEREKVW